MMKTYLLIAASLAVLLGTGGCVTDSAAPTAKADAAAPAPGQPLTLTVKKEDSLIPVKKLNAIQKGMTGAQIHALLGSPSNVMPFRSGIVTGEIWSYRISGTSRAEQISTSTRDIPYWDPVSNQMQIIKDPVYRIQHVNTYVTIELLMVDDRLIERRPGVDHDRTYD